VNYVDLIVIAIVALSALLAFLRGFVREVLGLGAWIAAGFIAHWAFPLIHDRFRHWLGSPEFGDAAALASVFVVAVVLLSFVSASIGGVVRASVLGGMDRTLGLAFGIARGVVLVAFAYIAAGWLVAADQWPPPVLEARSLPVIASVATWAAGFVPKDLHLHMPVLPAPRETRAEDFLRLLPQGRATAHAPSSTGG
jgi:membrane protein required for colicin V production